MTTASARPDSGDPGNLFVPLKLDQHKPELLTDATWKHLNERYQLRGELGQGGQARVFHMKERTGSHRDVAIKVYHENTAKSVKAFDNENRWLASRNLPEDVVVDLYDGNPPSGVQPYLVLELIDNGREIHEYAESPRPMTMPQRIDLYEKYLRTLHRFHDCGVVIGDVSARNVLVQPGDRIRFIDLAGAKPLLRGRSGSQSSINMATPGNVPAAVFNGDMSTSRVTDLICAANVGVQVLTGRSWSDLLVDAGLLDAQGKGDQTHPQALAICEQGLVRRDVPPAIRRIILKGLRLPDERLTPDPEVYATALRMADDIEAWRAECRRREELAIRQVELDSWRRHRNAIIAISAVIVLVMGAVGYTGWQRYWDARNATADAAEFRLWQSLQAEVRALPNLTHPAVTTLLESEKLLISQRDHSVVRSDQLAARKTLGELLAKSRDVLRTAREVDRAGRLREAIGRVLLEDEATERSGFWVTTAPMIGTRLDELRRRYVALAKQIDAGQIDSLPQSLATLQADLGELFKVNIEARSAFEARVGYQRAKGQVPERLRESDGFLTIDSGAQAAQKSWDITAWDGGRALALAKSQFGIAQQGLDKWLPKNLNQQELAALEKDSQARVAELEGERQKLLAEIDQKTRDIRTLNESFTKLTTERLEDRQKLKDTTAALVTANATVATQKKVLEEESPKLTQALSDLKHKALEAKTLNAQLTELTNEREEVRQKLESAAAALAAEQKQRKDADAKVATLETANKQLTADAKGLAELKVAQGTTIKELAAAQGQLTTLKRDLAAAQEHAKQLLAKLKPGDARVLTIAGVEFPFVAIPLPPNGTFKMGTPMGELGHGSNEEQVDTTLTVPFAALKTEVTQAMYTALTRRSGVRHRRLQIWRREVWFRRTA